MWPICWLKLIVKLNFNFPTFVHWQCSDSFIKSFPVSMRCITRWVVVYSNQPWSRTTSAREKVWVLTCFGFWQFPCRSLSSSYMYLTQLLLFSTDSGYRRWPSARVSSSPSFWYTSLVPVEDWRWSNWGSYGMCRTHAVLKLYCHQFDIVVSLLWFTCSRHIVASANKKNCLKYCGLATWTCLKAVPFFTGDVLPSIVWYCGWEIGFH